MSDRWTDRLSEYLDGSLSPSERREIEEHLAGCPACGAVLEDLRDVVGRARGLRELDATIGVGSDLWPGIEARIRDLPAAASRPLVSPPRRAWAASRFTLSFPQLAAAAVALVAISAGSFWFADDLFGRGDSSGRASRQGRVSAVPVSSASVDAALDEIDQLKKLLHDRREAIDAETLQALEQSLRSMEGAVDEARRALEADPGNPYIQSHLEAMRDRQLRLLRRAVALAGGAE
jgi:anti-sigma factor RsiW